MKLFRAVTVIALLAWSFVPVAQEAQVVTVQKTDIQRVAGEVVSVRGTLLTMRHDDGSGRQAYRIPRGASIKVQGEPVRIQDLKAGQKIRIYYRETTEGRVIVLSLPNPEDGPAMEVDELPVEVIEESVSLEAMPETLPDTAGPVPLIGLLGILLLGLGTAISRLRRRTSA